VSPPLSRARLHHLTRDWNPHVRRLAKEALRLCSLLDRIEPYVVIPPAEAALRSEFENQVEATKSEEEPAEN
jgi:hypothetical protein